MLTFEEYLDRMISPGTVLQRTIRKKVAAHPYLGEDDLLQDSLVALWQVWARHSKTKSVEDLCSMGFTAALRKVSSARKMAWARGEGLVNWVDLDATLFDGNRKMEERVADPLKHDERVFLRLAIQELDRVLSDVSKTVLGEILNPGTKTLQAVRRLWVNRESRNMPWYRVQAQVYAAGLGLTKKDIYRSLAEIRQKFGALQSMANMSRVGLSIMRPTNDHENGNQTLEEVKRMDGGKQFVVPDPMDLEEAPAAPVTAAAPPDLDLPPTAAKAGKAEVKTEGKTKGKPKAKPEPKEKAKPEPKTKPEKVKAEPKAKPAPKAKPEPKAKPTKVKAEKKPRAKKAAGDFREGSKRALVWNHLKSKHRPGQAFKLEAIQDAFASATKMSKEKSKASGSMFCWNLVAKGLIRRTGKGQFTIK